MTDVKPTAVILGISADIGREMALRYLRDGWDIIGTYRNPEHVAALTDRPGVTLVQCDPGENGGLAPLTQIFADKSLTWDLFFSSVGTMEPIGPFFETDFDAWERSVVLNTTAQLRALHMLHRFRRPEMAHVCFLAGGGTNGPFRNYSANCVSKIALIKMCELLHDESPDLNVFIVGPGFMQTKIHRETLAAGRRAGEGLEKTQTFLQTPGTDFNDLHAHLDWCMSQGRNTAGGRNFSTVHDPWRDDGEALARRLHESPDAFRLRRHDDR